jgi:hypothetical protein
MTRTHKSLNLISIAVMLLAMITAMLPAGQAGAFVSVPTMTFESFDPGGNTNVAVYGTKFAGQSFTTSMNHGVTSVRLSLLRQGLPGTLYVSIRNMTETGPGSTVLTTGTTDGNSLSNTGYEWREVTVSSYELTSGTHYAIVIFANLGDDLNKVLWRANEAYYSGGELYLSNDNGSTWIAPTLTAAFQVIGPSVCPKITTDAAINVRAVTADMRGQVNYAGDNGAVTYVSFGWGTESHPATPPDNTATMSDFGYQKEIMSTVDYTAGAEFSQNANSAGPLSPGTRYYFRAGGTDGDPDTRWSFGQELSFLTRPGDPTGLDATLVGTTQVDLTWTKGTGANRTLIKRVEGTFESETDDYSEGTQVYFDTGTSCSDTGLSTNTTTYSYRAWSEITDGADQQYSIDCSETWSAQAPTVTTGAVTNISTPAGNPPRFTLNGSITDVGTANCDKYYFKVRNSSSTGYRYIYGSFAAGDYHMDQAAWGSDLIVGTRYWVTFYAHNSGGETGGDEVTFVTNPSVPDDNLHANPVGSHRVDLSWNAAGGAQKTMVLRKEGSYSTGRDDGTEVYYGSDASCSDIGLTPNTQYFYSLWSEAVVDSDEVWSSSAAQVTATTGAPPPLPGVPELISPSMGFLIDTLSPMLEWGDGAKASTYGVQLSAVSNFSSTLVSDTGVGYTSYNVSAGSLEWGHTYFWRARSENETGNSPWSSARWFRTISGAPPVAPGGLEAIAVSDSQISLTWFDQSDNELGFKIERKTGAGGTWGQIMIVGAGVRSYTSKYLAADTMYYYRVKSYNAAAASDPSGEASATTLPTPPPAPVILSPASGAIVQTLGPQLSWKPSAGATGYEVQISTNSAFTPFLRDVGTTGGSNTSITVSPNLPNWNKFYYWRVRALGTGGSASKWVARIFKTGSGPPPAAPTDLLATAFSSTRIDLTWTDNSSNETGFKIERRLETSPTFSQITIVPAGTHAYSSAGLLPAHHYYYRVRAYNAAGLSSYSNVIDAMTAPPMPILLSPANGVRVTTLTPLLQWTASAGADFYNVQVFSDSALTSTVLDTVAGGTSYSVPSGELDPNTTYYWHVRASPMTGTPSAWSLPRSFRTPAGP